MAPLHLLPGPLHAPLGVFICSFPGYKITVFILGSSYLNLSIWRAACWGPCPKCAQS